MKIVSNSLEQTKKFALEFLDRLSNVKHKGAVVVGLCGNLGAGKTAFVQCVAEILGVTENVTSPTFVIIKSYNILSPKPYNLLVHIDAYRLKNGDELRKLQFEQLLTDPKNLILIEWADLVAEILPENHIKLEFEFVNEKTRTISSSSF